MRLLKIGLVLALPEDVELAAPEVAVGGVPLVLIPVFWCGHGGRNFMSHGCPMFRWRRGRRCREWRGGEGLDQAVLRVEWAAEEAGRAKGEALSLSPFRDSLRGISEDLRGTLLEYRDDVNDKFHRPAA
jgi:hypothetical protein